jgi:protein-tyrosine kinase
MNIPREARPFMAKKPLSATSLPVSPTHERAIGAILVDEGKLSPQDAERILALQKRESLRFGDAAVKLGLATPEDIQHALSRQFDYPYLMPSEDSVSRELVAAYSPFSKEVESLRALRSQLMLRWFSQEHKCLTIASPARGEGRSYLAANLAIVFSQLGERTLLIDADLRHPKQHELFKLPNKTGLSTMLAGRNERDEVQRITAFLDLSVLPAGPVPPNPIELLCRPVFSQMLERYADEYDVIILDTPAGVDNADVQTIAVRTGAAAVVVRRHNSTARGTAELVSTLSSANVHMVGSVLVSF